MRVLTVNAGSSSLKLRLLGERDEVVQSADLPAVDAGTGDAGMAQTLRGWPAPDATGHRIVHGGTRFAGPVLVDPRVERELRALTDLAPLHQPKSLAAFDAVRKLFPDVPAVACFDTAFHASMPAAAATYAVPRDWQQRYGVRRYGFHGLSHAYCSGRAAELLGRDPAGLRVVTCHLGAGASLAAVAGGRSVDTTMGFTPLEGLVMATRSGPSIPVWCCGSRNTSSCHPPTSPAPWNTGPVCSRWPAPPTCGTWRPARPRATRRPRWRSTYSSTAWSPGSAR